MTEKKIKISNVVFGATFSGVLFHGNYHIPPRHLSDRTYIGGALGLKL